MVTSLYQNFFAGCTWVTVWAKPYMNSMCFDLCKAEKLLECLQPSKDTVDQFFCLKGLKLTLSKELFNCLEILKILIPFERFILQVRIYHMCFVLWQIPLGELHKFSDSVMMGVMSLLFRVRVWSSNEKSIEQQQPSSLVTQKKKKSLGSMLEDTRSSWMFWNILSDGKTAKRRGYICFYNFFFFLWKNWFVKVVAQPIFAYGPSLERVRVFRK